MIRIRPGRAWRHNPRLLSALRSGEALAHNAIVDAVAIEVDGVDLAAGLSEDSVLEVVSELAAAVAGLAAGRRRGSVGFPAAGAELLLERREGAVRLSLVKLKRPARVVLQGVEVELEALCRATLDCGRALLRELGALNPALTRSPPAKRLAAATLRLGTPPRDRAEASRGARPRRRISVETPGLPSCAFEMSDPDGLLDSFRGARPDLQSLLVRGRLSLRLTAQAPLWVGDGYLFLMLRELTACGLALVRALEAGEREHALPLCDGLLLPMDLERGRAQPPGSPRSVPCDPRSFALCLFDAARHFVRIAISRSSRQRDNGYLAELQRSTEEGLARCAELGEPPPRRKRLAKSRRPSAKLPEPSFAPGRLRRLSYRQLWSAKVSAPTGLCVGADTVAVLGEGGAVGLSTRDGRALWTGPREPGPVVPLAGGDILVAGGRQLVRFGAGGKPLWSAAILGPSSPAAALCLSADGKVGLIASATEVAAFLLETGRPLWRFAPPGCSGLCVSAAPALALVATSDGRAYGIDPAEGRMRWRARVGVKVLMLGPIVWEGGAALLSQRPEGASVHRLDLATGRVLPMAPLELGRVGSAQLAAQLLLVAGTVGNEAELVSYLPTGEVAWRWHGKQLGAGMPQLLGSEDGAVLRGSEAAASLDGLGQRRWERPFEEESHGGPPPVLRRGVLLVAADRGVLALDPAGGTLLGKAGRDEPLWPALLAADDRLTLYCAEEDGPLEAHGLGTFLSVL